MADVRGTIVIDPVPEDLQAVDRGLHEHNVAHLGQEVVHNYHRLAILARDDMRSLASWRES